MEAAGNQRTINVGELLDLWEVQSPESLPTDKTAFHQEMAENLINPQSLVIKTLMAIGAWFGAGLFMIFLALTGLINDQGSALFVGCVFVAGYLIASANRTEHPLLAPFILALGMIGQVMMAIPIWDLYGILSCALVGLVVEVLLLLFSNSSIQRFISTLLLLLCVLAIIHDLDAYLATHLLVGVMSFGLVYIWMQEAVLLTKHQSWQQFIEPVGIGLAIGTSLVLLLTVNKEFYEEILTIPYWWASTVMIGCCVLFVAWELLGYYEVAHTRFLAILALTAVIAPAFMAPGIAFSLLLLLLGFFKQQRILLGWGVICLVFFVGFFYYNMNISLLWKSISLTASGLALLATRWVISRQVAD